MLPIAADAAVLAAALPAGGRAALTLAPGRAAYLVAARGRIRVGGQEAGARDGVAIRDEAQVEIEALEESEILAVDVRA